MKTINVTATRWSGGWELEISENKHTQVSSLAKAKQQVIDYLDTMYENEDHSNWEINILPRLEPTVEKQLADAKASTAAAAKAQEKAALQARRAVKAVLSTGITMTDCAAIMGVTKGRISQLAK